MGLYQVLSDGENIAAAVLDGAYINIEKSANLSFQRNSGYKYTVSALVKPLMVIGTDSCILSVLGTYLLNGKNNGASILKHGIRYY